MKKKDLLKFIQDMEDRHFSTDCDTGANHNAMFIWNQVREFAGLHRLKKTNLPSWCDLCQEYHINPCTRRM